MKNILYFFGILMLAAYGSFSNIKSGIKDQAVINRVNLILERDHVICSLTSIFSFCSEKSIAVVFCIRLLAVSCGQTWKYHDASVNNIVSFVVENLEGSIQIFNETERRKSIHTMKYLANLEKPRKQLVCDENDLFQASVFQGEYKNTSDFSFLVNSCQFMKDYNVRLWGIVPLRMLMIIFASNMNGYFDRYEVAGYKCFLEQLLPSYSTCNESFKLDYCFSVNNQSEKICLSSSADACVLYDGGKEIKVSALTDRDILQLYYFVQKRRSDLGVANKIYTIVKFWSEGDIKKEDCQVNSSQYNQKLTELQNRLQSKDNLTEAFRYAFDEFMDIEVLPENVIENMYQLTLKNMIIP